MLLAGDFNRVLNAADSTGHAQPSRTLATIVRGFDLRDVWNASRPSLGYTHYTPNRHQDWTGSTLLKGCSSANKELRQWHPL